jgi:predicted TPR repeat methyltransferase
MSTKKDPNDLGLQTAYGYKKSSDLQRFYDDTANGYEQYIKDTGYALPVHLVNFVKDKVALKKLMILDVGCGAGAVGEILSSINPYFIIDGVDFSIEMIKIAGDKKVDPTSLKPDAGKQIYRSLIKTDLKSDYGIISDCRYDLMVSAGVFTTGHLGFDDLMNLLPCVKEGGKVIVTVKKNVYEEDEFEKRLTTAVCAGVISEFSTQIVNIYENDVYNDQSLILYFTKI